MELDRLDLLILDHLQANGRATAQELGEAAHLSPSPSAPAAAAAGGGRG